MSKIEFENGSTITAIDSQEVGRGEVRFLGVDLAKGKDFSAFGYFDTETEKYVYESVDNQDL